MSGTIETYSGMENYFGSISPTSKGTTSSRDKTAYEKSQQRKSQQEEDRRQEAVRKSHEYLSQRGRQNMSLNTQTQTFQSTSQQAHPSTEVSFTTSRGVADAFEGQQNVVRSETQALYEMPPKRVQPEYSQNPALRTNLSFEYKPGPEDKTAPKKVQHKNMKSSIRFGGVPQLEKNQGGGKFAGKTNFSTINFEWTGTPDVPRSSLKEGAFKAKNSKSALTQQNGHFTCHLKASSESRYIEMQTRRTEPRGNLELGPNGLTATSAAGTKEFDFDPKPGAPPKKQSEFGIPNLNVGSYLVPHGVVTDEWSKPSKMMVAGDDPQKSRVFSHLHEAQGDVNGSYGYASDGGKRVSLDGSYTSQNKLDVAAKIQKSNVHCLGGVPGGDDLHRPVGLKSVPGAPAMASSGIFDSQTDPRGPREGNVFDGRLKYWNGGGRNIAALRSQEIIKQRV